MLHVDQELLTPTIRIHAIILSSNGMSYRLHRCVECPKCHTRYIIGANPYGNGSYIVSHDTVESDLRRLFCTCRLPDYHEFKLNEMKAYAASHSVYERGYGSPDEIVLLGDEQKQAS